MTNRTRAMYSMPTVKHPFLILMIFIASYFTTVSIKANAQETLVTGDAIQLQSNEKALITGTITEVKDGYFDMSSNDKNLRVYLKDVELNAPADKVLSRGMNVTVRGDMRGEEFGRTIVRAKNVVASNKAAATFIPDRQTLYVDR